MQMTIHHESYVYIMANIGHTVLYIGVTNDLARRASEHRCGLGGAFTSRYHVTQLVYYEVFHSMIDAISYEKTIKAGSRAKKDALIETKNPEWNDLSVDH